MKLPKFLVVVFSSCVFVRISGEKEFAPQSLTRSYFDSNGSKQKAPGISRDQETFARLESIVLRIEEKLEKFDEKIVNILQRLEDLDEKVDGIDYKLFNNDASSSSLSINTRLHLWQQKINELDHKIDKLINPDDKKLDDSSHHTIDQPMHLKLIEDVLPLDLALIALQTKESVESVGVKIQQNLFENGKKLEYLQRYLHGIFDENINKNISRTDEVLTQIRRKERRISNHSSLITDIVSMVRDRLKSEEEEDDTLKLAEVGSLTDILSNFENMTSPNVTQKIKTSASATRKGGLIFPNIKNKPSKLNTSFVSDAKDSKVS